MYSPALFMLIFVLFFSAALAIPAPDINYAGGVNPCGLIFQDPELMYSWAINMEQRNGCTGLKQLAYGVQNQNCGLCIFFEASNCTIPGTVTHVGGSLAGEKTAFGASQSYICTNSGQ